MNNIILSRRQLLTAAAAASATLLAGGLQVADGQVSDRSAVFENPLFNGDYPDPSILRVGGDFYLTHSCDHYAPQLVVWHSRDLVNWRHLSNVLDHTYGGVWAPCLIQYMGVFYIYFPMNGSIFVAHAADPSGWSSPIDLQIGGIDPGHVVGPDGTRYLYTAGGNVVQLAPDGLSAVGDSKKVYDGWKFPSEWATEGFWLESPALLQRGQYYYLISAEGGTSGPPTSHMSVVARSTSPLGPWENSPTNPLIHTYSADEAWWSVGHGTLVSTPDDRWYIVYHGYRNGFQTLGRNTLMEPIEWTPDGWPQAPLGARRAQTMPAPMGVSQRPPVPLSDEFKTPDLRVTWRAWNESDMGRFQVKDGSLQITAKGDAAGHSSPLTVMARDTSYYVHVSLRAQQSCCGAFGLFYDSNNWLFIEVKSGSVYLNSAKTTIASQPWSADSTSLKIVNRNNLVDFLISPNGRDWQVLAAAIDVSSYRTNILHGFLSLRPALAASGDGIAQFSDFVYSALPQTGQESG